MQPPPACLSPLPRGPRSVHARYPSARTDQDESHPRLCTPARRTTPCPKGRSTFVCCVILTSSGALLTPMLRVKTSPRESSARGAEPVENRLRDVVFVIATSGTRIWTNPPTQHFPQEVEAKHARQPQTFQFRIGSKAVPRFVASQVSEADPLEAPAPACPT